MAVGPAKHGNITNIAGFNYRMTEVTAAICREQLKKLNFLNEKRLEMVNQLKEGLSNYDFFEPLKGPNECSSCECEKEIKCLSTYYIFPIKYNQSVTGIDRNTFITALNAEGFKFYQGYTRPLYLQPVYQKSNC